MGGRGSNAGWNGGNYTYGGFGVVAASTGGDSLSIAVGEVQNPSNPKTLTNASRKVAERAMIDQVEGIGGKSWEAYGGEYTYMFDKGPTATDVAQSMSNAARQAGFETTFWTKSGNESKKPTTNFSVTDPKDYYKSIEVSVYRDTANSAKGKVFYNIDVNNAY